MAAERHPGITMHKLPVGGGFVGALFAIGSALIFVIGFPTLWYFVVLAFALGVGVAIFLKVSNQRRSDRNKPLSILKSEPTAIPAEKEQEARRTLLHASPGYCSL